MEPLEKIVIAQGNDNYICVVGSEKGWHERGLPHNLDVLKNYVAGLIDSGNYTFQQIENGFSQEDPWFYVGGEPLNNDDFQEVVKYVTPDPDGPGWA